MCILLFGTKLRAKLDLRDECTSAVCAVLCHLHTAVWARVGAVVVLTARLSLPGRTELIKLDPPTLPCYALRGLGFRGVVFRV